MNARFFDYVNDSLVRVTLRPGQSLSWFSGRRAHEEGWSSLGITWTHLGHAVRVDIVSDGRDCDGRSGQHRASVCDLSQLSDMPADEYGPARPLWHALESSQRDEYAEAAGY